MESKIVDLTYELKEMIASDARVILLNQLEERMNNDETVMSLAYAKDKAIDHYDSMLNYYKEDSKEVIEARKALAIAKDNLMAHPLVKEYLSAYNEVKALYDQVNEILFSSLNPNLCPKGK